MPIPDPTKLIAKNKGKAVSQAAVGMRDAETREDKIKKQILEFHQKIAEDLTENFDGEGSYLFPMQYAFKETVDTIRDEFNATNVWKVSKDLRETEEWDEKRNEFKKVMYLRFEKAEETNGKEYQ